MTAPKTVAVPRVIVDFLCGACAHPKTGKWFNELVEGERAFYWRDDLNAAIDAPSADQQRGEIMSEVRGLIAQIDALAGLPKDWNSYGAEPFSKATLDLAAKIAVIIGDGWKVCPSGDSSVELYRGDEDEIIFVKDDRIEISGTGYAKRPTPPSPGELEGEKSASEVVDEAFLGALARVSELCFRRLDWLHSSKAVDSEGYEYGVCKVKFDTSGQVKEFYWTLSDSSDIDALGATKSIHPLLLTPPSPPSSCPTCGSGKKEDRPFIKVVGGAHICLDPWHTTSEVGRG